LASKITHLANLVRLSRFTAIYTGAGISASVIGQAARSGTNKQGWIGGKLRAQPTFTHHALGKLARHDLIHSWVQQNHDGLPQKANVPQKVMNEIHGSWYDPSNPVVKYSGSLLDELHDRMRSDARTADLVIVLGTSLGGLNADQMAVLPACRSRIPHDKEVVCTTFRGREVCGYLTSPTTGFFHDVDDGDNDYKWEGDFATQLTFPEGTRFTPIPVAPSLGTVVCNLQQTPQDGKATLRIFGKSDDVLRLLLAELAIPTEITSLDCSAVPRRVLVPYDREGKRVKNPSRLMWWDLQRGAEIRVNPDHNIQGARQIIYMHIGSSKPTGTKTKKGMICGPGNGTVTALNQTTSAFDLNIEGAGMKMGVWWVEAAVKGEVDYLPVINRRPQFEDVAAAEGKLGGEEGKEDDSDEEKKSEEPA
jgi:hypothetical protein